MSTRTRAGRRYCSPRLRAAGPQSGTWPGWLCLGREWTVAGGPGRSGNARAARREDLKPAVCGCALHPLRLAQCPVAPGTTRFGSGLGPDAGCRETQRSSGCISRSTLERFVSAGTSRPPRILARSCTAGKDWTNPGEEQRRNIGSPLRPSGISESLRRTERFAGCRFEGNPLIEWMDLMQYGSGARGTPAISQSLS